MHCNKWRGVAQIDGFLHWLNISAEHKNFQKGTYQMNAFVNSSLVVDIKYISHITVEQILTVRT